MIGSQFGRKSASPLHPLICCYIGPASLVVAHYKYAANYSIQTMVMVFAWGAF
jgi:hypothetical protein